MLQWKWRSFQELTTQELYDILEVREAVFIIEQNCKEPDIDNRDQHCMHLLGLQENKLAAYLRVLPKGIAYPDAISFGRVLTAQFARGQGIGKELIEQTLLFIGNQPIIISAQIYLEKFYHGYGFKTVGEPYDEAGIIHVEMKKDG